MRSLVRTNAAACANTSLGLVAVGVLDYLTGVEIRVFTLYFLPLMLSAWSLGIGVTLAFSVLATLIWVAANYFGGNEHLNLTVWAINVTTQGSAFVLVPMLVAALHRAIDRERSLARTDPLTGLLNRRAFYETSAPLVELCHRNRQPVTLAYLDLDNFKQANDNLGHDHGDRLLKQVAGSLERSLRTSDVCCRLGGDEFVVMLPETPADQARQVLERVQRALAGEPLIRDAGITASIGAVYFPQAPAQIEPLVAEADQVMYKVKTSTKNRVEISTYGAAAAT